MAVYPLSSVEIVKAKIRKKKIDIHCYKKRKKLVLVFLLDVSNILLFAFTFSSYYFSWQNRQHYPKLSPIIIIDLSKNNRKKSKEWNATYLKNKNTSTKFSSLFETRNMEFITGYILFTNFCFSIDECA